MLLVEPAYKSFPRYEETYGDIVGGIVAKAGFAPDPEQQLGLDALFAVDGDLSAAFEFAVICSRQNMKTGLLKMAALGWLFVTQQRLIVWSAHEMKTTKEAFTDLVTLIEGYAPFRRRLAAGPSNGIHRGNGDESIELRTGQRIMFKARTAGGGRGLSGDKVILDEAFALKPAHMGSLLPTLSARPDPQIVYGSSAGLAESDVLRAIRDRGRAGTSPALAYMEWCDDLPGECQAKDCEHPITASGCRLDDRRRWKRANPAVGRRITEQYIANEREALPPSEFARERLGWWDEPNGESAIPAGKWSARFDANGVIAGGQVFALDVSPKMTHAAVSVAGKSASGLHTELLMREGEEDLDYRPGTEWVVPAFTDLKTRIPNLTVVIAANGQAKSLAPDLKAAGIAVEEIGGPDVASACGLLFKLADQGGLTHSGQPELAASVAAGQWRDTGEGAQVWGRRKSGEITGLYATTLAVWVAHRGIGLMHPINNVW